MTEQLVLPIESEVSIALAGGKGQSLSRLSREGIRVPEGKILTTKAYTMFVDTHSIRERVFAASLPDIRAGKTHFS